MLGETDSTEEANKTHYRIPSKIDADEEDCTGRWEWTTPKANLVNRDEHRAHAPNRAGPSKMNASGEDIALWVNWLNTPNLKGTWMRSTQLRTPLGLWETYEPTRQGRRNGSTHGYPTEAYYLCKHTHEIWAKHTNPQIKRDPSLIHQEWFKRNWTRDESAKETRTTITV